MGKNLIQQRRGRGTSTFRKASFRQDIRISLPNISTISDGKIIRIVHSAMHSAPLAEVKYSNGEVVFAIAPDGVREGDLVTAGITNNLTLGTVMQLKDMPEGTSVFNLESVPGDGGKFVRASGGFAKIATKTKDYVMVKLPSGKIRNFIPECRASIGVIAGSGRLEKPMLKAGKSYHKWKARNRYWPIVCGQSMNAVAHPFGKKSSHTKGRPHQAPRNAPPGRKVGSIAPRRTGFKR